MMTKKTLWTIAFGIQLLCAAPQGVQAVSSTPHRIQRVAVNPVMCPVGTAPRLPYQLWVTYADGTAEFRQVRWTNSSPLTERAEADAAQTPVGTRYVVKGFILGDTATDDGYPVEATVEVVDATAALATQPVAHTVPLTDVTLQGDNRLTSNRDLAIREIISWDVTQQLYNYRDTYGLSTEGYTRSDGWDSPDTKLKGHGSGHYMSALALAYASATDPAQRAALGERITRMVNELRQCQERTFVYNEKLGRYWEARDFAPEAELREMKGTWQAFDEYKAHCEQYGYGYLNAIPAQHAALIEMYRAYNNSDWVWAPYYSIHKQLAGLIDIATYYDNKEIADKALLVAKDMGLWVWNRMHYRTFVQTDGTQDERRSRPGNRYEMWNMYIAGEVGGIGESLARLAEMVSNPEEKARLIEASNCFDSPAFFDPLSRNIDDIRTRHANQHIPMIIAALRSYLTNQNPYYYQLSENFWSMVQGRYRYATGGVGNGEMFRQPYSQILSMATNGMSEGESHSNPDINETCCAYNLLKLTRDLNCLNPNDARYMDYYERTLYNQIVGSLNPVHYQTTYQYAVGLDASKPWGNETPQSTCCGGTGSENHVKYQEATYFVGGDTLWVALYMPTQLQWKAKGITLQQDCTWPAQSTTLRIAEGNGDFTLKLRVPYWATEGFTVRINGKELAHDAQPCSYLEIPARHWQAGDEVEISMPFTKHMEYAPDKLTAEVAAMSNEQLETSWVGALMYGPLVMTATDVTTWGEATLNIDDRLASVTVGAQTGAQTGTQANLYTLIQGGKVFQPDYYRHEHTTHYFRIHPVADPTAELKMALGVKLQEAKAYPAAHYTKKSYAALKKATAQGEKLMQIESVDEAQVSTVIAQLDEAANALTATTLHREALKQAVAEAEKVDSVRYTTESYEAFALCRATARRLLTADEKQTAIDQQVRQLSESQAALVDVSSIDKQTLREALAVAEARIDDQTKWEALEVKVPEYAPWARHGYMRLMWTVEYARDVNTNQSKNYSQGEVNSVASQLNSAINTMRPGNLPEMEDLRPLSALLRRIGTVGDEAPQDLKDAVAYAEMVMSYVKDGSGTQDMIDNAVARLKPFYEKE
jgi:DUF1680 family protein